MWTQMTSLLHVEIVVYKVLFVVGLYAVSVPQKDPAKLNFGTKLDSAMSAISSIVPQKDPAKFNLGTKLDSAMSAISSIVPQKDPAKFNLGSKLDSAMSAISSIVPQKDPAKFNLGTKLDSAMPAISSIGPQKDPAKFNLGTKLDSAMPSISSIVPQKDPAKLNLGTKLDSAMPAISSIVPQKDPTKFNLGTILDSVMPALSPIVPQKDPAKFNLGTILDSVMPAISPIVNGPNKCEALKSLFGLTYEQMSEKNSTNFHEALNIDLITKNGNIKYNLNMSKRLTRVLEGSQGTVVLVHGFLESSDGLMVNGLSPGLLKQDGLKILALDGRKLINLEYFRSSTYARFMGERLGTFLGQMVENGQEPSKITLIGHSLGAHIAGIAGKKLHQLSGKLAGQIIGLDAASPCFGSVEPAGRLLRTDAEYVMVVHTNTGTFGISEPIGAVDLYPNGGESQPGCYLATCSHSRAWELLAEAIITPDHLPARKCENWTKFQSGLCSKNEVTYLALNSKPAAPGSYYFTTSPSAPFGLGASGSG